MSRIIVSLLLFALSGCASVPTYCKVDRDQLKLLRIEERLECLEVRMTNTETTARIAVGVGVVGAATGAVAIIGTLRTGKELKTLGEGLQ